MASTRQSSPIFTPLATNALLPIMLRFPTDAFPLIREPGNIEEKLPIRASCPILALKCTRQKSSMRASEETATWAAMNTPSPTLAVGEIKALG